MTETVDAGRGDVDSNLAMLGYGLLFVSILFAGLPGLVAVVIAYAQRDSVNMAVRSHYNFQIRIFWIALALTAVAAVAALLAIAVGVGQIIELGLSHSWDAWDTLAFNLDFEQLSFAPAIVMLLSAAGMSFLAACLWLLTAPIVGFIRLVSQRGMGDRAA
ncbi:MAG TPA: hypothetical protein VD906_11675 [Caulobacteraceae bacterium]|nr:hypothetical protein [Caulobacteraceae bacterium]